MNGNEPRLAGNHGNNKRSRPDGWQLFAMIAPVVTLIFGFLLNSWVSSKDELFKTLISQNTKEIVETRRTLDKVMSDWRSWQIEHVKVTSDLCDTMHRIQWAITMPFKEREKKLPMLFKLERPSSDHRDEK